jgi:4-amino-4-deoxy-L-arabinose transferase-like glycosyltransferase
LLFKKLSRQQIITLLILLVLSVAYYCVFIPVNSSSSEGGSAFSIFSGDEYITYPYVEKMLRGGSDIHQLWGNLIIYGDYHYGYPFYFLSMLVLLPRRLVLGDAFFAARTTNIFLLRQLVNVLPMILAAGVLVYYKTRFRNTVQSTLLFLLFLMVPSVVRSNIWWWHPDSITFLFIALTFLFLQKDDYRLGRNFILAAVTCGLAAGTKLLGFFFFLTIPVYLVITHSKRGAYWTRIIKKGLLFVFVMTVVIVLANPFLWYEGPRNEMIAIQQFKQTELEEGYTHGDPSSYQKGPSFWQWTIENWFGAVLFIVFLVFSTVWGVFQKKDFNENIYLITWSFPFTLYVLFFVAPKPDHYIFPALMPLFLAALDIPVLVREKWKNLPLSTKLLALLALGGILVILVQQIRFSIVKDLLVYQEYLIENM